MWPILIQLCAKEREGVDSASCIIFSLPVKLHLNSLGLKLNYCMHISEISSLSIPSILP